MKHFSYFLVFSAFALFTACTAEEDPAPAEPIIIPKEAKSPIEILKQNVTSYGRKSSSIFIYSGTLSSSSQAKTRGADVNGNQWSYLPEYPTTDEIDGVLAHIQSKPEGVAWPGYTNYYVQHITGAHHTYYYNDFNGAAHNMDGTNSMENMRIQENDGNWTPVNNFNVGKCDNGATHNCTLMTNGFISAKTLNEYSGTEINQWKLFFWEGNYYLGFDYSCNKDDAKTKPAVPGDGIYDDWIVKIIPGANETPVTPDGPVIDEEGEPVIVEPVQNEVEFDVHQQEHKDWKGIKTAIHIRDSVNARLFIPVPEEYQALADDFDIRIGDQCEYGVETLTYCDREYEVDITINHKEQGIEIIINAEGWKDVIKSAAAVYNDGVTFEVYSYLYSSATNEQIWNWVKQTECLHTTRTGTPQVGDCATHTRGQVSSKYYPDETITFEKDPE